jgi:DNA polymerase III epsilon subunit-like protein
MNDKLRLLGLDIETTGSDFKPDIKTIQIGVFDPKTKRLFRMDVGWPDGTFTMVPEATAVHNIPKERILAASYAATVDYALLEFLTSLGVGAKQGIAVGFNVGSFDMTFVRRDLPNSASLFSYRTIDLNAVCFAIGEATGIDWKRIKDVAVADAKARLRVLVPDLKAHDAGYDAMEAVLVFEFLTTSIREKREPQ